MKFITEGELRDRYRKEPFTAYGLPPDAKLTPGARQFLTDLRIDMHGDGASRQESAGKYGRQTKRLIARLKSLESLFLLTCKELLDEDAFLAREILGLESLFSGISAAVEGTGQLQEVPCEGCTGISSEDFDKDVGDCFDITEFHMRLGNGAEILKLHRLRCALREVEAFLQEVYEESGREENVPYAEILYRINIIVNFLSRMICMAVGGKKCLRIK
ncbi:MAG TPA: hypothetical protein VN381_00730 [Anaerovoracaceae bacterium]|nr:hypothetical protein [Anaerovoracaceae bacterium]